jgi:hypothetical protein
MALRHPNLPKASLHGKELYIEGETKPYLRQPGETIWLRVDGLRIRRGYELEDQVNRTGDMVPIEFLIGTRASKDPIGSELRVAMSLRTCRLNSN